MSERATLLLLDNAMQKYGISRDDIDPIVAMKLAVILDDTTAPPEPEIGLLEGCGPGCACRE